MYPQRRVGTASLPGLTEQIQSADAGKEIPWGPANLPPILYWESAMLISLGSYTCGQTQWSLCLTSLKVLQPQFSHLYIRAKNYTLMKNLLWIRKCNGSIFWTIKCSTSIALLTVLVKVCSQVEKNHSPKCLSFWSLCLPIRIFMARLFQPKSPKRSASLVYYREKVNVVGP